MLLPIHVASHSICGMAGWISPDYRADVLSIVPVSPTHERIYLRLSDDMVKPEGAPRRQPLKVWLDTPRGLQNYGAYKRWLWRNLQQRGLSN